MGNLNNINTLFITINHKQYTNLQVLLMNSSSSQPNDPKFTFTAELTRAIKQIQQRDGIEQQTQHNPSISESPLKGNIKMINNHLARLFQSRQFLIFALITWEDKFTSTLSLYYYSKARGENESRQIPTLKGRITAMEFAYPYQYKIQDEGISSYQTMLIMGNEDGFVKILDFRQKQQIKSFQIDTKTIVDIKIPPPESFSNHPIFFALVEDYSVYVVSIKLEMAVAHLRPTIMMCDASLSLSLHQSMKYMLETTKGGYIILWKINQNLYKKLDQSNEAFKSQQKIYNVFPTSILHSASIQGLKWASFLGDFIAIITTKGVFKIIALNIDQKQQYAVLLEYQIPNGQTIKDAKLFPKQECLVVVRQDGYSSVFECIFYSPELLVTSLFRMKVQEMPQFDGFLISSNFRYLFLRSSSRFFVAYDKIVEEKMLENKKENDSLRQSTF